MVGRPTLEGPLQLSIRVGISAGRLTSLVAPARSRHVVVHLGAGLTAAVAAQGRADVGSVVIERPTEIDPVPRPSGWRVPSWAPSTLHPVTASRVGAGGQPPDEHRRVTSVFLSLPAVDDRDAAALAAFAGFVTTATDLIEETGGDVLQCTGGDKGVVMFAVFGTPVAHPDDPARAVRCVERIRESSGIGFRAGVATGLAFTASFGGGTRRFMSALGDTTNLAARLMVAADQGATMIDGRTAAASSVTVGPARLLTVKGKADPQPVHHVLGVPAGGIDAAVEGATPLVGRRAELAAVEQLLDRLTAGHGSALHVVGEAGMGKSRLVAEAIRRAEVRGIHVEVVEFEAFGLGQPLGPFARLLRRRLQLSDAPSTEEIANAVAAVRPDARDLSPLLATLLETDLAETNLTEGLRGSARSEAGQQLLADLLCSSSEPTVFVLEDVHWADEASRNLISAVAARLGDSNLALLSTSRPGATELATSAAVVVLGELPHDDLAVMVRDTWSVLGGGELPQTAVETIVERAAGSPLFAETVTEIVRRSFQPGQPFPELPLPDQLLAFLTARLDALGDSAQRTALRAAVLGRPATAAEIASIFDVEPASADTDLELLVESGIAKRSGGGPAPVVWLRHASVAEALLARASYANRSPMHELVCAHLVTTAASAREIARQLEFCSLPELEQRWYPRARDEATTTWALHEARHWAELVVGGDGPAASADLLALAELEQQLGDHPLALQHLAEIRDDPAVQPRVESLSGRIAFETGHPAQAVEHLLRAEQGGDDGPTVSWPLTMALCDLGRYDEARALATSHLEAATSDNRFARLDALANLGVVAVMQGQIDEAAVVLEEARALALELGDLMRLGHVTGDLAGVRFLSGRLADAATLLAESTDIAYRLGARRIVAMTLGNLADVRLAGGDRDGAARAAVAGARSALALGDLAMTLDCIQTPIVVAELRGDRRRAATGWKRLAELEALLGRPHDEAICWLRYAALECDARAIARADRAAGQLDTPDLRHHRQRAMDASTRGTPPLPEEAAASIVLPPLDARLPVADDAAVDDVLDQIERMLR